MFEVFIAPLDGYRIRIATNEGPVSIELAKGKTKGALRFSSMGMFKLEMVKEIHGNVVGEITPGKVR